MYLNLSGKGFKDGIRFCLLTVEAGQYQATFSCRSKVSLSIGIGWFICEVSVEGQYQATFSCRSQVSLSVGKGWLICSVVEGQFQTTFSCRS